MPATTSNSSNKYFPGQIEHLGRMKWQRAQADRDRIARFESLNRFVMAKGGAWITSPSGDREVRLDALPGSAVVSELREAGYDLVPDSPPEGQRIVANATIEDVVAEGSSRAA